MRALLSAYGCEPNKGSEQEIGWQRALHMTAFADEVWVLTRSNNRPVIEQSESSRMPGLQFIYYDLPAWAQKLKKKAWFFPAYLVLWQWGAYRLAATYHRKNPFDAVYHVTFSSLLYGSFMGRLGIPFIVGPIAGGERASFRLRRGMPASCRLRELLRDIVIFLQRYSPIACPALAAAERIYVTSPESLRLVRPRWHSKTSVQLSVASCAHSDTPCNRQSTPHPKFVFVGRLLHWKGVHFAIRALAEAKERIPSATLTLFGTGPGEDWLRRLSKKYGVEEAVEFAGHAPRQQLIDALLSYTALIFPSLHDSGGLAVLEALSKGLPVVCLDLGGPGAMVNASCGVVIQTVHAGEAQIVTAIANAMTSLAAMSKSKLDQLSKEAVARSNELTWTRLTERVVGFQPE